MNPSDFFVDPFFVPPPVSREAAYKQKRYRKFLFNTFSIFLWAFTDSNRRPSACKADALNQLS